MSAPNGKLEFDAGALSLPAPAFMARTAGTLTLPIGERFGLQADFSASTAPGFTTSAAFHLFARDPQAYLIGGALGVVRSPGALVVAAGPEAELYLDRWTLEAWAGASMVRPTMPAGPDRYGVFALAGIGYYPTDNWRLSLGLSTLDGYNAVSIGTEYLLDNFDMPVAVTGEARIGQDGAVRALVGLRGYFGPDPHKSLIDRHRQDDPADLSTALLAAANPDTLSGKPKADPKPPASSSEQPAPSSVPASSSSAAPGSSSEASGSSSEPPASSSTAPPDQASSSASVPPSASEEPPVSSEPASVPSSESSEVPSSASSEEPTSSSQATSSGDQSASSSEPSISSSAPSSSSSSSSEQSASSEESASSSSQESSASSQSTSSDQSASSSEPWRSSSASSEQSASSEESTSSSSQESSASSQSSSESSAASSQQSTSSSPPPGSSSSSSSQPAGPGWCTDGGNAWDAITQTCADPNGLPVPPPPDPNSSSSSDEPVPAPEWCQPPERNWIEGMCFDMDGLVPPPADP